MHAHSHAVYAGQARDLCRSLAEAGFAGGATIETNRALEVTGDSDPIDAYPPMFRIFTDPEIEDAVAAVAERTCGRTQVWGVGPERRTPRPTERVPSADAFRPPDVQAVMALARGAGAPGDATVTSEWTFECTPLTRDAVGVISVTSVRVRWVDGPPTWPLAQRLPGWSAFRSLSHHGRARVLVHARVTGRRDYDWDLEADPIPDLDSHWAPVADLLGTLAADNDRSALAVLREVGLEGLAAAVHGRPLRQPAPSEAGSRVGRTL